MELRSQKLGLHHYTSKPHMTIWLQKIVERKGRRDGGFQQGDRCMLCKLWQFWTTSWQAKAHPNCMLRTWPHVTMNDACNYTLDMYYRQFQQIWAESVQTTLASFEQLRYLLFEIIVVFTVECQLGAVRLLLLPTQSTFLTSNDTLLHCNEQKHQLTEYHEFSSQIDCVPNRNLKTGELWRWLNLNCRFIP